jgi:hypothetical protein
LPKRTTKRGTNLMGSNKKPANQARSVFPGPSRASVALRALAGRRGRRLGKVELLLQRLIVRRGSRPLHVRRSGL